MARFREQHVGGEGWKRKGGRQREGRRGGGGGREKEGERGKCERLAHYVSWCEQTMEGLLKSNFRDVCVTLHFVKSTKTRPVY